MKLVVDIGNSRIKWARAGDGGRLEAGAGFPRQKPLEAALDTAWADLAPPAAVLVSSVAGAEFEGRLEQWMARRWGRRPGWFRSAGETLGLVNGYADPGQLGSDRWAALVGARGLFRGPLGVIDAGTAITLDAVDGDDRHVGGLILPGPELAERSLAVSTARIREAPRAATRVLGRSTGECVANGVRLGLAGAIDRWVLEVDKTLSGVTWLATGGSWPELSLIIEGSFHHDPDLVLRGLARVLESR